MPYDRYNRTRGFAGPAYEDSEPKCVQRKPAKIAACEDLKVARPQQDRQSPFQQSTWGPPTKIESIAKSLL